MCITACSDTEDGSYVKPITISEKLHGEWILNSMKQVDEATGQNLDLTDQFNFMSFAIDFKVDSNDDPTTFSIAGSAPSILPTSGSWDMAHNFTNADGTASKVNLYSDNAKANKIGVLTITKMPGNTKALEFKLTRKTNGVAYVSYVYNLAEAATE